MFVQKPTYTVGKKLVGKSAHLVQSSMLGEIACPLDPSVTSGENASNSDLFSFLLFYFSSSLFIPPLLSFGLILKMNPKVSSE